MWNFHNGSDINEIDIDRTPVIVRFSFDGMQVIIGCVDYHLFIWDWQKRDASLINVILPSLHTVEIACDSNMIFTCSRNMHVCKINLRSLQISNVCQGLPAPIISPNGKTVIYREMNEFNCYDISAQRKVKYNAGEYITNYLNFLNKISGSLEYIANKTVIGFDSSVIYKIAKASYS